VKRKRDQRSTDALDPALDGPDAPELCRRAQRGDRAAVRALLANNEAMIRWLVNSAAKGQRFVMGEDDFRQLARLHMLRAILDYDPKRARSPATCVRFYVGQELRRSVRGLGLRGIVRVSRRGARVLAIVQQLNAEGIERPTVAQVRARLEASRFRTICVSDDHITQLIECAAAGMPLSLDNELAEVPSVAPSPWQALCAQRDAARIEALLRQLPKRSRDVISLRFGLYGESRGELTAAEAGRVLGMSAARVRRIEQAALRALREAWAQGEPPA
jgi:RNA polymerase sigma factor (sigma-70 family)